MLSNAFWRQRVDPVVLANMDRALHRLVKSLEEHGQGEEGLDMGLFQRRGLVYHCLPVTLTRITEKWESREHAHGGVDLDHWPWL